MPGGSNSFPNVLLEQFVSFFQLMFTGHMQNSMMQICPTALSVLKKDNQVFTLGGDVAEIKEIFPLRFHSFNNGGAVRSPFQNDPLLMKEAYLMLSHMAKCWEIICFFL